MRILFVDDHALLRQSVAAYVREAEPEVELVESGSVEAALGLLGEGDFDLLVTDLGLGEGSGLSLVEACAARGGRPPALVLSMHDDLERLGAALGAGARGYVAKSSELPELLAGMRAVAAGGRWLDQRMLALVFERLGAAPSRERRGAAGRYGQLTEREREIFLLLAGDSSIEEIAAELGLSAKTVENHRSNVYAKLGLGDRLSLYRLARDLGLAR